MQYFPQKWSLVCVLKFYVLVNDFHFFIQLVHLPPVDRIPFGSCSRWNNLHIRKPNHRWASTIIELNVSWILRVWWRENYCHRQNATRCKVFEFVQSSEFNTKNRSIFLHFYLVFLLWSNSFRRLAVQSLVNVEWDRSTETNRKSASSRFLLHFHENKMRSSRPSKQYSIYRKCR